MSETAPPSGEVVTNVLEAFGRLTSLPISFERFVELSRQFPEFRMEQEPNGQVTVMPPTFFGSSNRESELIGELWLWNRHLQSGKVLSPSGGIQLPDGSTRCPDAAWVSNARFAEATAPENSFLSVVPEFVVEIRSFSDDVTKMHDSWMKHGVLLAWLIDPYEQKVWIYRENGTVELVEGFAGRVLSGEAILPGFELELERLLPIQ